jgi:hypothetical protein
MFFGSSQPVIAKASTIIHKPADHVFQFIGENFFENYPKWSPEVIELKALSEGPVGIGTLAKQTRIDHGHRSESTFRVTHFEPNKRIIFSGVSNPYRCAYELEPTKPSSETTRVAFIFELPHLELYVRPFEKLIRVAVQDGAERTIKNLKGLIEGRS